MRLLFISMTAALLTAGAVSAQSYPVRIATYVNDYAGVLSDDTTAELNRLLAGADANGVEMAVVTIRRIADYNTGDTTIESFATRLFNTWGLGDAATNRGVLLLVALDDRKVRLELGRGWDRAYDATAKVVIDEYILPPFRQGDYERGIRQGAQEAVKVLTGPVPEVSPFSNPDLLRVLAGGGLVGVGVVGVGLWLYMRSRCPQCGQHTLQRSSVVLVAPTYHSTGEKEITLHCSSCGFHDVRLVTMAVLTDSSSDSGSGSSGGSDGGGSSDGGGASGSW
jgi:uncharacterized protein